MTTTSRTIMNSYFDHFISGLLDLCDLLKTYSENLPLNKEKNNEEYIAHQILQRHCTNYIENHKNPTFDFGKIIRKIYLSITTNYKLFYNLDLNLFKIIENDKIITIIPNLNIDLVSMFFNDDELKRLWVDIYLLYICSVELVYMKPDNRKKMSHKIYNNLDVLYNKLNEFNGKFTLVNIYKGVSTNNDTEILGIDDLYKNFTTTESEGGLVPMGLLNNVAQDPDALYKMIGDVPDIPEDSFDEINNILCGLFGTSTDNKPVINNLVKNVFDEIKNGKHTDMNSLLANIHQKVASTCDKQSLMKLTENKNSEIFKNMNIFESIIKNSNIKKQ